jgi:hypothetical protein
MTEQQEAVPTVGYIDEYSQEYRSLFADVRSFEAFKFVHVGMLSAIPRKSLPAIAKLVGLGNSVLMKREMPRRGKRLIMSPSNSRMEQKRYSHSMSIRCGKLA